MRTLKKIRIAALVAVVPFAAPAAVPPPAHQYWVIDGKQESFLRFEQGRLTISSFCLRKEGYLKCDAQRAMSRVHEKDLTAERTKGGKNPGSVLCLLSGGKVVFGTSEKRQSTFCRYGDGSAIEGGSLHAAALARGTTR